MGNKYSLVVLAAGMGSRYGGLKQLDSIGPSGETIIDYSIYDAIRAGFKKIVFIIRKDFEDTFKEVVGSKFEDKIEVAYAFQQLDDLPQGFELPQGRQKPWGTGHALLAVRDVVNEPFLVVNGDDYYGDHAFSVAASHLSTLNPEDISMSLVGFKLANTLSDHGSVSRGICTIDGDGNMTDVEEVTSITKDTGSISSNAAFDLTGNETVSMNMWMFTPAVVKEFEELFVSFLKENINVEKSEFFIPSAVNAILEKHNTNVPVKTSDSQWFGVTYKEDKPLVVEKMNKLVEAGVYPAQLWEK